MGKTNDSKWQVEGVDHIVAMAKQKDYKIWRTLWEAGDLKSKRANPFILFHGDLNRKLKHTEGGKEVRGAAGDVLTAPDATPGTQPAAVDENTSFKKSKEKIFLRLRVFDHGMQALPAEATWKLVIAGITYPLPAPASGAASGGEPAAAEGTFEAGGLINVELKPDTDWSAAGALFVKYPAPKPKEAAAESESGASTSSTSSSGSTPAPTSTTGTATGSGTGSGGSAAPGGSASATDSDADPKMIEVKFNLLIGRLDPIQEKAPDKRCTSGVQQRLNNMGFNTGPIDGAVGPITRGAIARFQRMADISSFFGSGVSGKADSATQEKLHELHDHPGKPATAEADTSERGGAEPADVGTAADASDSSTDASPESTDLRDRLAELANQEWNLWHPRGKTHERKEFEPIARPAMEKYWGVVLDEPHRVRRKIDDRGAWSAAFISWLAQEAGAGDGFDYHMAHWHYVGEAKRNRVADNDKPFKAYPPGEHQPRVGDIVCYSRNNSGLTYDNVGDHFRASHCDVVVEVESDSLITIGGNVRQDVGKKTVRTNSNKEPRDPHYYALMRVD